MGSKIPVKNMNPDEVKRNSAKAVARAINKSNKKKGKKRPT